MVRLLVYLVQVGASYGQ